MSSLFKDFKSLKNKYFKCKNLKAEAENKLHIQFEEFVDLSGRLKKTLEINQSLQDELISKSTEYDITNKSNNQIINKLQLKMEDLKQEVIDLNKDSFIHKPAQSDDTIVKNLNKTINDLKTKYQNSNTLVKQIREELEYSKLIINKQNEMSKN